MPDQSLPIIDLTYRLVLELSLTVGLFPRQQRLDLGRKMVEASYELPASIDRLTGGSQAMDKLRLLIRMAYDL